MGRRSIVSDRTKYEIARELGFADKIEFRNGNADYGNLTTREAGNIVRRLIEKAEEAMAQGSFPESTMNQTIAGTPETTKSAPSGTLPEPMAADQNKVTRMLDGNIDVLR